MWKILPSDEMEILKERCELLKKENKKEWDRHFDTREEVCSPSLSLSSSDSCE